MYADLAEYSIMLNGEKAITHTSSHYATQEFGNDKLEKITLPPITGLFRLTENTLKLFNFHSLVSLVSATPSLTSSSLAAELPLNSPRLTSSELHAPPLPEAAQKLTSMSSCAPELTEEDSNVKKRRQRLGPSCDHCRARKVKCNADVMMLSRFFDVAELDSELQGEYTLSAEEKNKLSSGEEVNTSDNAVLVVSNNKLIRFLPCSSCRTKNLSCCFSKGFTKEDVIHNKKKETWRGVVAGDKKLSPTKVNKKAALPASVNAKLVGAKLKGLVAGDTTPSPTHSSLEISSSPGAAGSTRKSSCSACRKRKIKCVLNSQTEKCMGCTKKDYLCSFEV